MLRALAALQLTSVLLGSAAAADRAPITEAETLLESSKVEDRLHALEIMEALDHSPRLIKALKKAIDDEDWGVQIIAAELLGEKGQKQDASTLAALAVSGEIEWVRDAAAKALGVLEPKKAAGMIIDHSKKTRDEKRRANALRGAAAVATADDDTRMANFAKNKDIYIAREAARGLALAAQDPERREKVMKALAGVLKSGKKKKHFLAYSTAVEILGRVDDADVRARLVREVLLPEDDDGYLLERVGRGLSAAGDAAATTALQAARPAAKKPRQLRRLIRLAARARAAGMGADIEKTLGHADERVRSESTRALGIFEDPASENALIARLDDRSRFVRIEAVTALRRVIPRDKFFALGEKIAKDKDEKVRVQFVVECYDLMNPAAIPALTPYLEDKHWRVASAAAAAVGAIGIEEEMPLLVPLLKHKDWRIRGAAYEGLGRLRTALALPKLIEGLRDRDPTVKGVCLTNLRVLTSLKWGYDAGKWSEWAKENAATLAIEKRSRKAKKEENEDRYARRTRDQGVEILQKARILVVKGAWDKVEVVLEHLDIPHTPMRAQELKTAGLGPNQILLVNCEGNVDSDTSMRIDWYVNVGGYLMTTDWALTKTVMPIFPGYVTQYARSSTGNDVVIVEEGIPGHPYTAGIFEGVPALQWWLEIQAFPITVDYPERVEVLVDSAEMRQRYGSSPMGVVFRSGLGRVQHSLSHFALQEEGMQHASKSRERMIFAADNLGLSLETIRKLSEEGAFDGRLSEETMKQIAPEYSMFRMIVNYVAEKSLWVEDL